MLAVVNLETERLSRVSSAAGWLTAIFCPFSPFRILPSGYYEVSVHRTRHLYATLWIRRAGRRNTGTECRYSEPEIGEPRQNLGVRLRMSLRRRFDRFADICRQTVALTGLISSNLNYGKEVYKSVNYSDTRTLNQKNENMLCSLWLLPRCPSTFISTFSSAQPQHSTVRVAIK